MQRWRRHAKRVALWGLWLEETLLAPVPHRQVVLTVPKRLRRFFLSDRALLGELSRVAARTVTAFIRATLGERDLAVGIVSSIQTHGSLANWHPHLHLLVTDGGFRPDGTFVALPFHDVTPLTEAFRRAVLALFVRRGLLDAEAARGMLAWPHSGVHVHDGVWVAAEDRAFAVRLARYCARNPVALGRLECHREDRTVTYHSDKPTGPTAGSETMDALEYGTTATSACFRPSARTFDHAPPDIVCYRRDMPITAKLSREFYDRFGDKVVDEPVGLLNQMDAASRAELRELNEQDFRRFEAKLEQRLAELRGELRREIAELGGGLRAEMAHLKAELIKWMFLFWLGTVATMLSLGRLFLTG